MIINNEFQVGVSIEQTWDALTDLERIAPCMPGAQLREIDGDEYKGSVKVKVGPITQAFDGVAKFVSQDPENHRAVISAAGREQRGQGTASATITTALRSVDGGTGTIVVIETDLAITGRAAQFGRSLLQDVSSMLLKQFVQKLEKDVLTAPAAAEPLVSASTVQEPASTGGAAVAVDAMPAPVATASAPPAATPTATTPAPASSTPAQRRILNMAEAEPIDLAAVGAASVNRMLVPVIAVVAVILGVVGAIVSGTAGSWLIVVAVAVLGFGISLIARAPRGV